MKKILSMGFVFLLGGLTGFVLDGLITVIPKDLLTASRINVIEREIHSYYKMEGKVPDRLDSLPLGKEQLADAWGNPLLYMKEGSNQCLLRSFRRIYMHDSVDGIIEKRFVVPIRNE